MRQSFTLACATLVIGTLLPAGAAVQTGERALKQGIQAYRELEMESAGWLLRQALASDRLKADDRRLALCYLGAAEFYRDRRDSALSAFTQVIRMDPEYRLDRLVFSPDVQGLFEEARRRTPVVRVATRSASFPPDGPGMPLKLNANTPHRVVITFESVSGDVLDTAFNAPVADTTTVLWNARGGAAQPSPVGGFLLRVSSVDPRGRVARRVELPVHVTRTAVNPIAIPDPPGLLPERQPAGPAFVRLGLGLAAAAATYLITPAFTDDQAPRLVLTGLFGAAGVIGFWEAKPGRPLPDNVVANETARATWRARVATVEDENKRRAVGGTVHVEVGGARVGEGR